jgi:hypothetical protein
VSDRKPERALSWAKVSKLWLWCARAAWVILPVTMGAALADALDGWSTRAATVAAVLLWLAWGAGVVAILALQPVSLTGLRVLAPVALVSAVLSISSSAIGAALLAVISAVFAFVLVLAPPVELRAANAAAYGDELRFPLRVPTVLLLGPIPVAVALVALGVSLGPLLIGADELVFGVVALALGLPLAALVLRSLHSLAKRWIVLVPAGVVVVDPLTLIDPVLVRREEAAHLGLLETEIPTDAGLDLRLGARGGSVVLATQVPLPFARRRGRSDAQIVETEIVLVAAVCADDLIADATARRIPTG